MNHVINDEDQDEYSVDIMLPYGIIESKDVVTEFIEPPADGDNERKVADKDSAILFNWRDPDP
jgi:hypothetical protein